MSIDLQNITPDKTLDARVLSCPGPLLEAKRAIASVTVGQTLEIITGDTGNYVDIPAWCKKSGHEYLGAVQRDGYDSLYVIRRK